MSSLPFAYKQPAAVCTTIACKHFPDLKVRILIKRTTQQARKMFQELQELQERTR